MAYVSMRPIGEEDASRPDAQRPCLLNHVNDPDPRSCTLEGDARARTYRFQGPAGPVPVNKKLGGGRQPFASSEPAQPSRVRTPNLS